MYAGRIVETGPVSAVFAAPQHPYTKRLLDSLPVIGGRPRACVARSPAARPIRAPCPTGCRFRPRCPYAAERCRSDPPLREVRAGPVGGLPFRALDRVAGRRDREHRGAPGHEPRS